MSREELDGDFLGRSTGWMFFRGGDTEIKHRCQGQPAEATGNIPAIFPHCQAPVDLHTSAAENPGWRICPQNFAQDFQAV
ncbi:hypothetical protein ROHU_026895 [Labeo rohita]|uniref:Uncharacterized protein n=1 Tax=Labeo rohita TaxID=84645 RepID=A0A498MKE9_LABRO|nr:hypothetical protein ROHU_026895 [Labeo rohita]